MKKIVFLLILSIFFVSCTSNSFKFTEEVDADVIGFTNRYIGLKYDLYGTTVFQDVYMASLAEFSFFTKMKQIPITVLLEGDDFDGRDRVHITLYYKGAEFGQVKQSLMNDLSIEPFIAQDMKIPTFKWHMFNEKEYDGGITPQQLRAELTKSGEEAPEVVVTKSKTEQRKADL